ncbi:hypothetical protein D3C81_1255440 [compost metagenome]
MNYPKLEKYNDIDDLKGGIYKLIDNKEEKVRKTYIIKASTIKMLNELKVNHPNVNVRISKLVDEAIRHYYEYMKEKEEYLE